MPFSAETRGLLRSELTGHSVGWCKTAMKRRADFSLLVVFLILAGALLVFSPVLKQWGPVGGFLIPRAEHAESVKPVVVWINPRSGLYYCSQSNLFGRITPGLYMEQSKALEKGYRPAEERPCL